MVDTHLFPVLGFHREVWVKAKLQAFVQTCAVLLLGKYLEWNDWVGHYVFAL